MRTQEKESARIENKTMEGRTKRLEKEVQKQERKKQTRENK